MTYFEFRKICEISCIWVGMFLFFLYFSLSGSCLIYYRWYGMMKEFRKRSSYPSSCTCDLFLKFFPCVNICLQTRAQWHSLFKQESNTQLTLLDIRCGDLTDSPLPCLLTAMKLHALFKEVHMRRVWTPLTTGSMKHFFLNRVTQKLLMLWFWNRAKQGNI